jgi:hypothetical protein
LEAEKKDAMRLTQQMTSSFTLSAKYFVILSSLSLAFTSVFIFSQKILFCYYLAFRLGGFQHEKGGGGETTTPPNRFIQKISSFLTYNPYQNFLSDEGECGCCID